MTQIYTPPVASPLRIHSSPYQRRAAQEVSYISPESQKAYTYLSHAHSDRKGDGSDWKFSEPCPRMSDIQRGFTAVHSAKPDEMYQARPTLSQNAPREQLPPLSSIFDTPAHQSRPAQSPYSDRHSPVFPSGSPHDARHPATPIHPDRSYDSSYYQRPSASHHYPYMSKPEQNGRPGPQGPSLPSPAGRRPESPRYDQRYAPTEAPRPPQPPTVNGWSPQSQARPEYFSRDTSSSFRTHTEQPRQPQPPLQRNDVEPKPAYGDSHGAGNYSQSSPNAVNGEQGTKDTLGPKIWSGTQFFPRFVRQAEVPGEGLCYFYDDGTHCKTVIDGEAVNAHWGVTKAGKPRKRLAIACITCREKKIKCDPDFPRCVQCEKFGRVCKFKNAPRGSQGSPEAPSANGEESTTRPTSSRTDRESIKLEKREISQSVSPRQAMQATPDLDAHQSKRQRTDYSNFTPVASEISPPLSHQEARSPPAPWLDAVSTTDESSLFEQLRVNPYKVNASRTSELLSNFFKHVTETVSCMLPESAFKSWALSTSEKSLDDHMLLYAILASGSAFSHKPENKSLGMQYAAISRYACDVRRYSLQLVQARLILAVYYLSQDKPNDSWDFCGEGMRAAAFLKLNVEMDKTDDALLTTFPYGLNRHGFAECRRRTYWSCFLLDRMSGLGALHPSWGHSQDVFLRLPCDTMSFETQVETLNPFYDPARTTVRDHTSSIGCLAALIDITTIWGDVMGHLYRMSQRRTQLSSNLEFVAFYDEASRRLREWKDSLLSCFVFSAENLKKATTSGKLGTYIAMHTVYQATAMKLNRYVPTAVLSPAQRAHHVALANHHAEEMLMIIATIAARQPSMPSPEANHTDLYLPRELSSPFAGHATVVAVDILTRRVPSAGLPRLMESFERVKSTLAELAVFWDPVKRDQALALQRIRELTDGSTARESADGYLEMRDPIDQSLPRELDVVYS